LALTGNLTETSFTDLIQFYSISRQTAAVTISSPAGREHDGVLYLEGGDVVDARFGELVGAEAVRRALRLKDGEFRVELNVKCAARTIFEPWSQLVLEEMCSDDEALNAAVAGIGQPEPEVELDLVHPQVPQDSGQPPPRSPPTQPPTRSALSQPPPAREPRSQPPRDPKNQPPRDPASQPRTRDAKTQPPPALLPRRAPIAITLVAAVALGGVLYFALREKPDAPAPPQPPQPQQPQQPVTANPAPKKPAPAPPLVQGVSDTEIVFGISAPFSGPAKELGREMKTGIEIAFAAANEAGGVNGRKLALVAFDDGYEPERAKAGMKELAEERKVFGFIGNVGTPTAEVTVPYALDRKMLFFGPFTGASLLRHEPPDRYVFNYRASYAEETAATVKYLVEVRRVRPAEIAVFAQEDGFGDAGFNGVIKLLRKYKRTPESVLRVGYKRNTVEIGPAVEAILKARRVRAVVMVATYKAAARFIEKVKSERPGMLFTNVSFVGSAALAEELVAAGPQIAQGVIVTQVVPLPQSRSTSMLKYQELMPKYSLGEKPDFISLEGYLAANLLIEGLRRTGRAVTTESLVDALEAMRGIDLGVGAMMSFGMSEHQASHKVWGTMLDGAGNFVSIELE